ncbi:MAG: NUDIX domain-containing protein [Pseudomonadota bacterium]
MSVWRPKQAIQVKAIGLAWRNGLLLASEIHRDDGSVKGVRPLGGRLEFGETCRDALVREFDEELGVAIQVIGEPLILENIYIHHGMTGHEIVFASDVALPDDAYPNTECIEYLEDNGETCLASWFDVAQLDRGGLELYPSGLKPRLLARRLDIATKDGSDPANSAF